MIYVYDRRTGDARRCRSAATTCYEAGFNANGIAATPNGKRLIIVQSNTGKLFTVDPKTGDDRLIDAPRR